MPLFPKTARWSELREERKLTEAKLRLANANRTPQQIASEGMAHLAFPYVFLSIAVLVLTAIYAPDTGIATTVGTIVGMLVKESMANYGKILSWNSSKQEEKSS